MKRYPTIHTFLAVENKEAKLEVHRSLRSVLSSLMIFIFSAGLVYVLNYSLPNGSIDLHLPFMNALSLRWLSIIPMFVLIEIVRKYHDDLYVLTQSRIAHHEGRLSLTSSLPSLKYGDIRSIAVNQDLIGRIFDYGNIVLSSAGTDSSELVLKGVRTPVELSILIEDLRMHGILHGLRDIRTPKANEAVGA